jgi:hypothetical protein
VRLLVRQVNASIENPILYFGLRCHNQGFFWVSQRAALARRRHVRRRHSIYITVRLFFLLMIICFRSVSSTELRCSARSSIWRVTLTLLQFCLSIRILIVLVCFNSFGVPPSGIMLSECETIFCAIAFILVSKFPLGFAPPPSGGGFGNQSGGYDQVSRLCMFDCSVIIVYLNAERRLRSGRLRSRQRYTK